MKRFLSQLKPSRPGKTGRRPHRSGPEPRQASIYEDMEEGAVVGFFASSLLALHFAGASLSSAILIFASSLGLFVGAVIGAVLWISAAKLPEEAVLNPAPGQARSKDGRRR